jgi:hypothetical protein
VIRRRLAVAVLAVAAARVGILMAGGSTYSRGDYYATLPGAYVETLNPALWSSPDLTEIAGKQPTYLRGPSQFLTLYPLAYLDSYEEIAFVLLWVYLGVILFAALVMWKALSEAAGQRASVTAVLVSTLLFFPLLQAYVAREFEVVTVLACALALWAAVRRRFSIVGGLLAYLSLFKYLPIVGMPYLVARRSWAGLAGFTVVAVALLALADRAFGLDRFYNNHIPAMASGLATSLASTRAFCDGAQPLLRFSHSNQETSMRFALCAFQDWSPIPMPLIYLALLALMAGLAVAGFLRLERVPQPLPRSTDAWRGVWELSLVVIAYTTAFYSHYYYLSVLIVPLNALLVRAWFDGRAERWRNLMLWAGSYVLLGAFLVPPTFLSRQLGVDVFGLYMRSHAYFAGELLLVGLVLQRYLTLESGVKES